MAKEIYGNTLARSFGLPVPQIALADFTPDFIGILNSREKDYLSGKHSGVKFSSELADGMVTVSSALYRNYLNEYDVANVFAFDCLIYNVDRGGFRDKPNLLVDDESFLLIDHELSFPFADNEDGLFRKIMQDFRNDRTPYMYQKHLFYSFLKNMRKRSKIHAFEEFHEYLSTLKVQEFELVINELDRLNISIGHYDRIIEYLYTMKSNAEKFCGILCNCIK